MENHVEALSELKKQLEEQQQLEQRVVEQQSEEIVEEAVEEVTEELEDGEDQSEGVESDIEEDDNNDSDEGVEDEYEEEESDAKKLRKRIEGNYREKIKERDAQIRELRDQINSIQQQVSEQKGYNDALRQQDAPVDSDPEPDALLDPEEHTSWQIRQMKKENDELRSTQEQHAALIQDQQDRAAVAGLEADYKRRNPDVDYESAKEFIKERERRVIKLQYPDVTDAQIDSHFANYELDLFKSLAQKGQNATDVIVNMAAEYGYEPSKSEPVKKKPNLKKIKQNQEKNASLIGGSDVVSDRGVSAEQIFEMSMDQLASGGKDLFAKAHKSIERNMR